MCAELGACMRSWVHVWGTVLGLPAELGAPKQAPALPLAPGPPPPSTHAGAIIGSTIGSTQAGAIGNTIGNAIHKL